MVNDEVPSEELRELATSLLEVVPLVARAIRSEMRAHRNAALSVPQFRVLNFVHFQGISSLSAIAAHMGLTMPSASAAAWKATCDSMQRRLQRLDASNRRELHNSLRSLHLVFG